MDTAGADNIYMKDFEYIGPFSSSYYNKRSIAVLLMFSAALGHNSEVVP